MGEDDKEFVNYWVPAMKFLLGALILSFCVSYAAVYVWSFLRYAFPHFS